MLDHSPSHAAELTDVRGDLVSSHAAHEAMEHERPERLEASVAGRTPTATATRIDTSCIYDVEPVLQLLN